VSGTTSTRPTEVPPGDRVRQVIVAATAVAAIVGALIGSGVFGGTPIADAAGGALSADATLIAPAGPAFSIWSVIYLGLVAYAVWQFFPGQGGRAVHRRIGYWLAASLALNAAWIGSVQAGLLGLSVVVIVALLVVLCIAFVILRRTPDDGTSGAQAVADVVVIDGTIGLYLGWVTIATAANITAWLTAIGFTGSGIPADVWGIAVVAVAGLIGVGTAVWSGGRLAPAVALAWGLAWIAVARATASPESSAVAVAAVVTVVAVLACAVIVRLITARQVATA
jgi:hypothetical protein